MADKIIPKDCYEIFRGACERIYDLNDTLLDIAKSCDTDIPDIYMGIMLKVLGSVRMLLEEISY